VRFFVRLWRLQNDIIRIEHSQISTYVLILSIRIWHRRLTIALGLVSIYFDGDVNQKGEFVAKGYKGKLLEEVKSLSEERIKAVADFAAYLKEREEWETTAEILGDKKMAQDIKQSRKDWNEGKKENFVPLDELKAKLSV